MTIDREKLKALAWNTEDHVTDKSATTYDAETAKRWAEKGWPVAALYSQERVDGLLTENEALRMACASACDALEVLRRGHGCQVSAECYPALNYVREALDMSGSKSSFEAMNELEALRKDAERYRWLRGQGFTVPAVMWVTTLKGAVPIVHSDLDDAIDSAMSGGGAVMTDANKMREQFEEFYPDHLAATGWSKKDVPMMLERDSEGGYKPARTQGAWWAWQASREAVVVELPSFTGYKDHIVRELQAAFTEQAERQGLKVKP